MRPLAFTWLRKKGQPKEIRRTIDREKTFILNPSSRNNQLLKITTLTFGQITFYVRNAWKKGFDFLINSIPKTNEICTRKINQQNRKLLSQLEKFLVGFGFRNFDVYTRDANKVKWSDKDVDGKPLDYWK